MRVSLAVAFGLLLVSGGVTAVAGSPWSTEAMGQAAAGNCVAISAPKPAVSFEYRYTDSTGATSDFTNRWEIFTATSSRLITTKSGSRGGGVSTYVGQHHVANDLLVLERSTASGTDGGSAFSSSMSYAPGAIGDPAFRACAGQTWQIPSVTATSQSTQGKFSAPTDPGTLRIVAINVSVTVPAGTFDTVQYTKTMKSARGQVVDEFWKSTVHGVTVKRTHASPGVTATEVLQAIK